MVRKTRSLVLSYREYHEIPIEVRRILIDEALRNREI